MSISTDHLERNLQALDKVAAAQAAAAVLPIDMKDGPSLDYAEARRIGESLSAEYCFAEPFPHIVLDNFLPKEVIDCASQNFPKLALKSDRTFEMGYAGLHKRQILPDDCNGPARDRKSVV